MRRAALMLALATILPAGAPRAQAPQTDPNLQRAQAAFEALAEAERRQIQLDLGFVAGFSGSATGGFGPLTYRAIQAFERQNRSTADGVLDAAERQALAAAARREREALGFRQVSEPRTRVSIGLPMALLTKAEPNAPGGPRWQTADGKVTVALRAPQEGTLDQLFEAALTSPNPQRRVTYRLLRPDFFVVAGETPQGKFYQRMAKLPDGTLRGFVVSYDKALAPQWDRLTIAVANAFEPGGAVTAAASAAQPPSRPAAAGLGLAPQRTVAAGLTALVVAPGRALTAAESFKSCREPKIGGRPARLAAEDGPSGLALVEAASLDSRPVPLASQAAAGPVAVLARRGGELLALPGEAADGRLSAALQPGGAGAPFFAADGLAGIVVGEPSVRLQVAGTTIVARQRIADATVVGRFLASHGVTAGPPEPGAAGLGATAARHGGATLFIACD